MLKYNIPIQEISCIEIECVGFHIETEYFKFRITLGGCVKKSFELEKSTIKSISDTCEKIAQEYLRTPNANKE